MQTWYCSVSLRWKRRLGGGALDERRAHPRALPGGARCPALRLHEQPLSSSCLRFPAAATTMFPGTYIERWYAETARRETLEITSPRPITGRPSGCVAERRLGDQVVDELLRLVLVHRDLLEHDLALGVELGERRREDHLPHHVERGLEPVVGDARVDDRVLARGGRVQLAAEPVEDLGDLLRAVRGRALEEQVLEEMRDARLRVGLVARAGADPEADRDRAHAREPLRDQPLAGIELGQDVLLLHRRIVLAADG